MLSLYIAAVHDHQGPLWSTLTAKLSDSHQEIIQRAFEYLLENRSDLTKEKLEHLFNSSSPSNRSFISNTSTFSTPYRATPSTSSLGESFNFSPSNAGPSPALSSFARGSPLQEFLKTHHSKKVLEGVQQQLRDVKTALDSEKGENLYLKTQLESINIERDKLKNDLDVTKSQLFAKSNGQESEVSVTGYNELQEKYVNLQQKLVELKDSKIYIKKVDLQLEKIIGENKELTEKYDQAQGLLNEKSGNIKLLQEKLINFEMKTTDLDDQNRHLKETVNELNKQMKEMQEMQTPYKRQSMMGGENLGNLNDISLDNPGGILSPGESMGDMVVLNLQEDNAVLRSELSENQEKYLNVQKQYELEQANANKNANLANTLQGKLDGELKRVEELVKKLGNEHSNLKKVQQSFDLVQQENADYKVNYFWGYFK